MDPRVDRLLDQRIEDLILEHYERFDAKYKSLLPLRRVYIPVPVDEA